jgi:hypothetical protein
MPQEGTGTTVTSSTELPPLDEEGQLVLIPKEILDVRERKLRSRVIREYFLSSMCSNAVPSSLDLLWKGTPF